MQLEDVLEAFCHGVCSAEEDYKMKIIAADLVKVRTYLLSISLFFTISHKFIIYFVFLVFIVEDFYSFFWILSREQQFFSF